MSKVRSIEDLELNSFHRLMTLRTNGGWLIDGYVLSIIGVIIVQMTNALDMNNFWQGMIGASAIIGVFLGGFIVVAISDKVGRKPLYFVGPILFLIGSVAQFWFDSALVIFILRMLIGIGVGFEYAVASALLVEYLPKKHRGNKLAHLTTYWFVGAALAYIVGNIILAYLGDEAWKTVLASSAVLSLALILVRIGTPESARWLMNKGREQEADQVIKKIFGNDFSIANLPIEEEKESKFTLKELFFSGYGARLFFVIMFWMCAVIPLFAVYAFAPKVLNALNLTGQWERYGSIAITVMFALGCVLGASLIEILGRRKLLIHSFLWSGLALFGLGVMSDASEIMVLVLFSAYGVLIGGAQVLELVYPNEIFPTEIRSAGIALGSSFSRIGAAIGTFLVPIALSTIGISWTMYIAAIVTFVGLVVTLWLAPETKGLTLEQASSLKR